MYHSKLFGHICAFLLLSVLYVNAQTGQISTGTGTTGTTGIVIGTTGTTGVDVVYTSPLSNQTNTDVTVSLPAGTVQITFPPLPGCEGCTAQYSQAQQGDSGFENPSNTPPTGATFSGVSLFISITDNNGNPVHVIPRTTITITTGNDVTNQRLYLFNTTSGQWEDASLTCSPAHIVVDVQADTLHVDICHLTQFATFNHPVVVSTSSSSTTTGGGVTKTNTPSGVTNSGLIAIVIVVPVVVVGVIVALVAWTLLRNRKNNSDSNPNNTVEMGTRKSNDTPKTSSTNVASSPSTSAPKKVPESSSESEESESEEESEGKAKKESESEESEEEKKSGSESESESSESESESKSK